MGDELFRKLRERSTPEKKSEYSFGGSSRGGDSPFSRRPSSTTSQSTATTRSTPAVIAGVKRDAGGDRPPAYQPPATREEGKVYEWEPPGFRDIMKDLGLRVLEVAIAASAYAIGEEIAYFFRKRRFYTREQRNRRDW